MRGCFAWHLGCTLSAFCSLTCRRKSVRPAAVLLDNMVDVAHGLDRFAEADDYLLIVSDSVFRQGAVPPILEPLIAYLVATNVKIPYRLRYSFEAAQIGRAHV